MRWRQTYLRHLRRWDRFRHPKGYDAVVLFQLPGETLASVDGRELSLLPGMVVEVKA